MEVLNMNHKILISLIILNIYTVILPMDPQLLFHCKLDDAAKSGDIAKVNELLAQGANPNYKDSMLNWTPLHQAAENGHLSVVLTLINHGADPNSKSTSSTTPLHLAAENGHSESVLALLQKGAAINALDENGMTPLHGAAQFAHADTIDILFMKKGADINARNNLGETPLFMAVKYNYPDSPDTVQKLLDYGADPDIKGRDGNTALHQAARFNKLTLLKTLLAHQHRPDPFITNDDGNKAFDVARDPLIQTMLRDYETAYNQKNLKLFTQELRAERNQRPGDAIRDVMSRVSEYF